MMTKNRLQKLTTTAILTALSVLLSFIIVWRMPQGGTVTAGCMTPLLFIAWRCGWGWGVAGSIASGLLQFIFGGTILHPLSILLDYVVAYGIIGLAGFGKWRIVTTCFVCLLRLAVHTLSGATLFAIYANGQNPWVYSFLYNSTYMIPETIVTLTEVVLLYKFRK